MPGSSTAVLNAKVSGFLSDFKTQLTLKSERDELYLFDYQQFNHFGIGIGLVIITNLVIV